MEIVKIHFSEEPTSLCDYRKQDDGFAEVWLFDNVQQDDEGWIADGVFLRTMQTKDEVLKRKSQYFKVESQPEVNAIVHLTRQEFKLLDATKNKTIYYVTEPDGTVTMIKGDNR